MSVPSSAAVVVLAAGTGSRVGADRNKVLLPLHERPLLAWSVRDALACARVATVVVVVHPDEVEEVGDLLGPHLDHDPEEREVILVAGGTTRHGSEQAALGVLGPRIDAGAIEVVAFHDAARPLAGSRLLDLVLATAEERGGALPVVRLTGLVTRDGTTALPASAAVQTPQAFRAAPLRAAYQRAAEDRFEATDTAGCLERYADLDVVAVPGSPRNLKVTFVEDLALAARLLSV